MDTSSTKLLSGFLSDHEALGVGGDPVYRAAEQIRTLIQKELGESTAQIFAIPVRNEKTNELDWYSPIDGNFSPFSNLSYDQQAKIKEEITDQFLLIDKLGKRLNDEIGTEAARTYASLLDSAKSFPSDDQIFVINGKPVITFWGFKRNIHAKASGLIPQVPVVNNSVKIASSDNPVSKRSWWQRYGWWLVLIALLILGIPALLKSCASDFPLYKNVSDPLNCPPSSQSSNNCPETLKPNEPLTPNRENEKQVLSPEALKKNDLRVFEGKWVLVTELRDLKTQNKIVIDLDLGTGGNGSAGTKMVGQTCSGAARVSIDGSKNFNVFQDVLNCTDGSQRRVNTYNCTVRPNQTQADCVFSCIDRNTMQPKQCDGIFEKRQ